MLTKRMFALSFLLRTLICVAFLSALRLYGASFTTSGISVSAPVIALGETFHATLAEGGFDYHPLPDNEYFVRKNSESYAWEIRQGLPEWQGPVVRSGTGRSVAAAGLAEGIYTLEFSGSVGGHGRGVRGGRRGDCAVAAVA